MVTSRALNQVQGPGQRHEPHIHEASCAYRADRIFFLSFILVHPQKLRTRGINSQQTAAPLHALYHLAELWGCMSMAFLSPPNPFQAGVNTDSGVTTHQVLDTPQQPY